MFRNDDGMTILKRHMRLEDFMGKKNMKKINRWKTRYFVFRNRGLFLCYFANQVQSTNDHPLGVLNVCDILSVTEKGSKE